jgi:hypothetical protein
LLNAVSKANYCLCFNRKTRHGIQQIILGRSVNTHSARMQFEYLVQAVDRLAKQLDGDRTFSLNKKKPHISLLGVWDEFLGDEELSANQFNPVD